MKKIFENLMENKNFKMILVFGVIKKIILILLLTFPFYSNAEIRPLLKCLSREFFLSPDGYKFNTMLLTYVQTVFQKGGIVSHTVLG